MSAIVGKVVTHCIANGGSTPLGVGQSRASTYWTWPITMSCVSGLSRTQWRSGRGNRRNVPVK